MNSFKSVSWEMVKLGNGGSGWPRLSLLESNHSNYSDLNLLVYSALVTPAFTMISNPRLLRTHTHTHTTIMRKGRQNQTQKNVNSPFMYNIFSFIKLSKFILT